MKSHIENICQKPKSRRLEFKEKFPKGDQFAKTVIAFANGAGGKIIFGVKDRPRQITGLRDEDIFLLEEHIANHISDHCLPNIILEIYIQFIDNKNIGILHFPASIDLPVYRCPEACKAFIQKNIALSSTIGEIYRQVNYRIATIKTISYCKYWIF